MSHNFPWVRTRKKEIDYIAVTLCADPRRKRRTPIAVMTFRGLGTKKVAGFRPLGANFNPPDGPRENIINIISARPVPNTACRRLNVITILFNGQRQS